MPTFAGGKSTGGTVPIAKDDSKPCAGGANCGTFSNGCVGKNQDRQYDAGAARIYGFVSTDMPLSAVQACVIPEHRPVLDRALRDLVEQNVPYDREFTIRRATDGEMVHVHSRAEYDPRTNTVFGVVQDITDRKRIEEERERLIVELRQALEQVRTLRGIVPICSSCKKIRDDRGYWEQVEAYVAKHTDAKFSHGICPDCEGRLYPGA